MEALRLRNGRAIPAEELRWTFARASGPGGQSVNTSDTSVRLAWDVAATRALTDAERERVLRRLAGRLTGALLVVRAAEHRSQWANRRAAAERLLSLVDAALAPAPPSRRPTTAGPGARARRRADKRRRSEVKQLRRRPGPD